MSETSGIERIETGVRNLDAILGGGIPEHSVVVLAGPPGSGKTILAQQICFHASSATRRVLYVNTLSEPTAKTLRYLRGFDFFDATKLGDVVRFVDLGVILRTEGLQAALALLIDEVKKHRPAIVVIDSFRVFDEIATSPEDLRKFGYEMIVKLMAWECTTFLLGEYSMEEYQTSPIFSIIDGLIALHQAEVAGEQQRFLQVVKMRGTDHERDVYPFMIQSSGIEIFAPRTTIHREAAEEKEEGPAERGHTGIEGLDQLLGEGIPKGSSLLVGGVAGTGKTVLLLEFLYRGALMGERGILFSFEETPERLRAAGRGLGWDLDAEIEKGMIEIVFIPQPDIIVEKHLLMMQDRIQKQRAQRVSVDSFSVFVHKIKDPKTVREKVFQLASIVQNERAIGFFATDIPYGSNQISRFGVEETVVDGVILLSATEEGLERQRYIEVYKLRNTAHAKGRHVMAIRRGGTRVYPRYEERLDAGAIPSRAKPRKLATGVPGLDELVGGGLLERSLTLVSGNAGVGKSTFALQFLLAAIERGDRAILLALEEGTEQIFETADGLALPVRAAVEEGHLAILSFAGRRVHPAELLAIVTDEVRSRDASYVAIDGAGGLGAPGRERRALLRDFSYRFKELGVTSLVTTEVPAARSTTAVEATPSTVADNLVTLRYVEHERRIERVLTIVKTRGTSHTDGAFPFEIREGGMRLNRASTRSSRPASKREKKTRRKR